MEAKIRAIYDEHRGRYGYRRIAAALCISTAEPVNLKCVQRLVQKTGLRALIRAKKRSRHVPHLSDVQVPNVLQRDFFARAPNQKRATNVSEFNVRGHKLYLSACMDLYNGDIGAMLAHHGVKQSLSRRRNCFDKAVLESFFSTLKAEYCHLAALDGIAALEAGVHNYIRYNNHDRIKFGFHGFSPVKYRLRNTA